MAMTLSPSLRTVRFGLAATLALLAGAVPEVSAQVWTNLAGGSWNTSANWTAGTVPNVNTAAVTIGGGTGGVTFSADTTVTVDGSFTVDTVTINSAQPFTLAAGSLTFAGAGSTPLTLLGNGLKTISTDLAFNTTGNRSIVVAGNATISGVVSGTAGLTKGGAGALTFTGNNTFAGALNINSGTVLINSLANSGTASAAGQGSIIRLGAAALTSTLVYTGPAASTNRQLQIGTGSGAGGGEIRNDGSGELTFTAAAPISAQSTPDNRPLTLSGSNNGTIQGGLTNNTGGTIGVIKDGAGRWTLAGANTYTGGTTVSAGTLQGTTDGLQGNITNNAALIFDQAATGTYAGVISGTGTLTKQNTGTVILSGANTYSGGTTVNAGTLKVNGSIANSAVTVNGGFLGGSGTIGDLIVASGGTLSPGNSPGTLSAGATTFAGGGSLLWEINNATGTAGADPGWDLLSISGALNITASPSSMFTIDLTSLTLGSVAGSAANFDSAANYSFAFVTTTGGITGFDSNAFTLDTSGFQNPFAGTWSIAQSGNDLTLNYAAAIPEPATYAAWAGAAALGLVMWRRRGARRLSPRLET